MTTKTQQKYEKLYGQDKPCNKDICTHCSCEVLNALKEQEEEILGGNYPKSIHKLILDDALKAQRQKFEEEIRKHTDCFLYHEINGNKATCLDKVLEALTSNNQSPQKPTYGDEINGYCRSLSPLKRDNEDKTPYPNGEEIDVRATSFTPLNDLAVQEDRGSNSYLKAHNLSEGSHSPSVSNSQEEICECGHRKDEHCYFPKKHKDICEKCYHETFDGKEFTPKRTVQE